MRLRDHYDWIVLGDDPGALLSASLASKLGLSVLVLPLQPAVQLLMAPNDDRSDESILDLETNYVPGLGSEGLWESALIRAGMAPQEQAQVLSAPSVPQILTSRCRVSLEPDRAKFKNELAREFGPSDVERVGLPAALERADSAVTEFWLGLPERLTVRLAAPPGAASTARAAEKVDFGKESAKKVAQRMTLSRLATQLARVNRDQATQKPWFSGQVSLRRWSAQSASQAEFAEFLQGVQSAITATCGSADMDLFSIMHLLSLSRSGAAFRGGMSAFREFLLRLARRNGADIPDKTECRRIFVQNGRFAGVLPSIRGSMIAANGGILGVPLEKVQSLVTVSGRSWLKGFKTPLKASGWKFTIALTLHPEAVPPGMARRVIWQEKDAPFLEIERVHPSEYGLKDRHRAIVFIRTLMPMTEESLTPAYQRLIAARLLRKATEISPFLEYHITKIFPDFRSQDVREISEIYRFQSLSEIPHELLSYEGEGLGSQSGIEGLFLSSRESFPRIGLQGGAISALEGVAWAAHRSGLAGPYQE
jgi:hypothetical protein